ncbi:MAG: ABC transporter ATP-binding protein [Candidatus Dormibacteria bacterium]
MSVLLAEGVTAGYGKVPIVQGISARAEVGQVVSIVGPNGAGKSTFLKSVFGLLRKVEGKVVVDGLDVTNLPPHRIANSGMAYVPQVNNVFPSMSVVENLEMGAFTRRSGMNERIEEVLAIFPDLLAARKGKAGVLSGGQRNMLGMARGLMLSPRVVLLDEPTAGLSPAYTTVVWKQVRRIAEAGTAVIVVEQNVDLAVSHSDWTYVLVAGRNRLDGPATEVAKEDLSAIFLGGGDAAKV